MNETDFRALIATRGQEHWWHSGMRAITQTMIGNDAAGRALDIGCGPGVDLQHLPPDFRGFGIDVVKSQVVPSRFAIADGGRAPLSDATFDLILLLDVLEQAAARPAAILREVCRLLRPGGRMVARVPAYPWLHGARDAFWGGARRYRRSELAALVQDAGLTICRLTYANCLLFAPAAVARLLGRVTGGGQDDLKHPPTLVNNLFRGALFAEAHWLRRRDLPFGLSLICVATRGA